MASVANVPELDDRTFRLFSSLIESKAGIKLGPHKHALVSARVNKRMRAVGIQDFGEYYTIVQGDTTGRELVELLDVISTNVTQFFREPRHFDLLRDVCVAMSGPEYRLRVWSAACSSGEEPYSIAMTLTEAMPDVRNTKILATDISTKVLAAAKAGQYMRKHIETVPAPMLAKYFGRSRQGGSDKFDVVSQLKKLITFGRLNLSKPPFPMKGPFDVIFCRNVMIYFDNDMRRTLLAEMHRLLRTDGLLMVGHAESLSGMLSEFKPVEPSVYTKK